MYFYHAHAIALGGRLGANSVPLDVPNGSCALAVTGGAASAKSTGYKSSGITFQSAETKVSGSWTYPRGLDVWATEASVVIQGLNLFDRITADTIEAHIYSEYRWGDYEASTVITGSSFVNVQIDKKPLKIETCNDFSRRYPTFSSMQTDFQDSFSKAWVVDRLMGHGLDEAATKTQDLRDAFDACSEQAALTSLKQLVVCSFVTSVSGGGSGSWGPIVAIPNLGNLYLGELIVWPWMRCLTMFRLELLDKEGKSAGSISGGSAGANGGTFPPGLLGGGGYGGGGG